MVNNPSLIPLTPDMLQQVAGALPPGIDVYLVGGAVRDMLLGRVTHDMDFVLQGDVLRIARALADQLGAAYYPLDEQRDTARLIFIQPDGSRQVLDFARMRGPDLESDLRARDFTVNAMALDVRNSQALIDPLHGLQDLREKKLRACSPAAFTDDPLRILRAIRQAAAYRFQILAETRALMRAAVPGLAHISPERLRDELFRILGGPQPVSCLRALDLFEALLYVLPELVTLKGVEQSRPHINNVWDHTLDVAQKLADVLEALSPHYDPDTAGSLFIGMAVLRLGRFRPQIADHMNTSLNTNRPLRPLLLLAALYHDIGKPITRQIDEEGRIRFFGHDQEGAGIAARRARALRLSNGEVERVEKIVQYHMRPLFFAQSGRMPSRRSIYRFFRKAGPAGVDICLLSLADVLATSGPSLPPEEWAVHLDVVRSLLEAWWERPEETISPKPLLNGYDLIQQFKIGPGPLLGRVLEAIREAQATGQVSTREEALSLAQKLIELPSEGSEDDQG